MMNTNLQAMLWAMSARGLDPTAYKILIKLACRVNSERRDFDVWPSHKQLAEDAEVSVATLKRHLPVLVSEGYLKILPQTGKTGGTTSNRYRLRVKAKLTMPNEEIEIDADAMDQGLSWGVAQSELGGSSLVNHASEPLKDEPTKENPSSPDGEDPPVERDLLGDPIVTAEQRKAAEEQELVELVERLWHALAVSNPMTTDIEEIGPRRRKAVLARAADFAKPERGPREVWLAIFEQITASTHLRGLGKPGKDRTEPWAADFDWLIGPINFGKVLEGKYRDRRQAHPAFDAGTGRELSPASSAARRVASRLRAGGARPADGGNPGGSPDGRRALPGR